MTLHSLLLCLPLLLAACAGNGLGNGNAGTELTPVAASLCTSHGDQASCEADARCEAGSCPSCGGTSFLGCYDKGSQHGALCATLDCARTCHTYPTLAECDIDSRCVPLFEDAPAADCAAVCLSFARCTTKVVDCVSSPPGCANAIQCPQGYANVLDSTGGCSSECARISQCLMPND